MLSIVPQLKIAVQISWGSLSHSNIDRELGSKIWGGSWELTQWVKCSLHMQKDLSSESQCAGTSPLPQHWRASSSTHSLTQASTLTHTHTMDKGGRAPCVCCLVPLRDHTLAGLWPQRQGAQAASHGPADLAHDLRAGSPCAQVVSCTLKMCHLSTCCS